MKLKDYTKEELEAMSYDDIAFMILTESKKKMKINELFQKICDLLDLSQSVFTDKIADFFEVLSTDQRFLMLADGSWDLKSKHSTNIIIDDEEEDMIIDSLEEDEEFEEPSDVDEEMYYDTDETDDQDEDDLKDFVILDEDEETGDLN